jgi:UDP-N-acetylglucosamine 4,6-dehydratase
MSKYLIIGGTGSLGYSLVKRLYKLYTNPEIIIVSRDEDKQWRMKSLYPDIKYFIGDIREKNRIEKMIFQNQPNVVIIAAALKHIDICEKNIDDCIYTNIIGIQNVINIIYENSLKNLIPFLETVVFISTDKATSPVNVYGMCKAISERIVSDKANLVKPKFINVRYGNVLNSRGSLFPLFHDIGKDDSKTFFPVTHPDITRFFMHIDDSIDLIFNAINKGESGDTFIPKVNAFKVLDVAECFARKYEKPIRITGLRPGEKLHECLINETEKCHIIEEENYFILRKNYVSEFNHIYSSEVCADNKNLIEMMFDITK